MDNGDSLTLKPMKIKDVEFIGSFPKASKCPPPDKPEFAFLGRSNVGKSSLINMLCERKKIAKVSHTPGKTQLLNFFLIDESWYMVDLPGYGYAKVSKRKRGTWQGMIGRYLVSRPSLLCVFLLIDVRVPPQASDMEACAYFGAHSIPFALVFTKADKPSQHGVKKGIKDFQQKMLLEWESLPKHFVSSAKKQLGRQELLEYIDSVASTFSPQVVKTGNEEK